MSKVIENIAVHIPENETVLSVSQKMGTKGWVPWFALPDGTAMLMWREKPAEPAIKIVPDLGPLGGSNGAH